MDSKKTSIHDLLFDMPLSYAEIFWIKPEKLLKCCRSWTWNNLIFSIRMSNGAWKWKVFSVSFCYNISCISKENETFYCILTLFFLLCNEQKITKQRRMMKFFNESMIDHRAIKMSSTNEAKMRCNDMELRIIFLSMNSYYLICKIDAK